MDPRFEFQDTFGLHFNCHCRTDDMDMFGIRVTDYGVMFL